MSDLYCLRGVQQRYGGRPVLNVHDMVIRSGELLVIMGPSGAGKTTLLRLLNFLETPFAGTIAFGGSVVNGSPPLDILRRVTTVFQAPALLNRSVRDNVAFGLRLRGESPDGRLSEVLSRMDLESLADAPARLLSGGELQRVALARALVLRPEVLLLDEPTANLDPYNVGLIESMIRALNADMGTTVVLVTHNLFQARRLATRSALLIDGSLVETGPVPGFFTAPRDPRTSAFLSGEMLY